MTNPNKKLYCLVDNHEYDLLDGNFIHELDPYVKALVKKDYADIDENSFICNEHLLHYRLRKMDTIIKNDISENRSINKRMNELLSEDNYKIVDVEKQLETTLTMGQRIADAVARFGGSWPFVLSFVGVMVVWVVINVARPFGADFDPYPFILLNLFLSMVAAIQAPLIMMSQNRASSYDRMESRNDYHVNLKSEEEIRLLHDKIDHLIQQDQPNNLEIQKMQMEMLASINTQLAQMKKEQDADKAQAEKNHQD
ncbi:DUF1003 domain-containing protein [Leuconostocaceae bacterium ESL0723]|nr:DUF1003 domain-containing protein [Lactobacillaceae bacterium L1_55_11]WEV53836.1 DUF1003 domain-containing protein [Leuconostocaceae bacterium ESL0723]